MGKISVTCDKFIGSYQRINGTNDRHVSRLAILRAVLTVGAQSLPHLLAKSWREWGYRYGIGLAALAYLEEQSTGLCLCKEYENLDGSEKTASSNTDSNLK